MDKEKKKSKFQSPIGMHDILPEDQVYFQKIYKAMKGIAEFYNFKEITTPILEETALFEKATGDTTDIVEKQMFILRTKKTQRFGSFK